MKIKTKINKWDLIKLKSFCTAKETITKQKDNPQNGRKYLQTKNINKKIQIIQNEPNRNSEVASMISEMKNSLEGPNSRCELEKKNQQM